MTPGPVYYALGPERPATEKWPIAMRTVTVVWHPNVQRGEHMEQTLDLPSGDAVRLVEAVKIPMI